MEYKGDVLAAAKGVLGYQKVVSGGQAANAGLGGGTKQVLIAGEYVTIGGDIIIAINCTK